MMRVTSNVSDIIYLWLFLAIIWFSTPVLAKDKALNNDIHYESHSNCNGYKLIFPYIEYCCMLVCLFCQWNITIFSHLTNIQIKSLKKRVTSKMSDLIFLWPYTVSNYWFWDFNVHYVDRTIWPKLNRT